MDDGECAAPHVTRAPVRGLARGAVNWYRQNGRKFPWREEGIDPWLVLLAEMLLRQTDAKRVVPVFVALTQVGPDPASLAHLAKPDLMTLLRPLGLHRRRAAAFVALGAAIEDRWAGKMPTQLGQLRRLPHVGPYAAGAVTVFALGGRAPLADVNVARIGSRYFGVEMPRREKETLRLAQRVLRACPRGLERPFMYGLLDLSAALCRPRNPRCTSCPLHPRCKFAKG